MENCALPCGAKIDFSFSPVESADFVGWAEKN
jgi:hypothetical protein